MFQVEKHDFMVVRRRKPVQPKYSLVDSQNWKLKQIPWKLVLLMFLTPITHKAIAKPTVLLEHVNSSVTASEIEPHLSPIPQNIKSANILSDKQFHLLNVEETGKASSSQREDTLDFSDTGRAGQQSAGEARGQCGSTEFPLTALVPVSNWGKTVKEHPTFWFYVPSHSTSTTQIEFVLQDQDRNNLSKQQLSIDGNLDYVNARVPQDQPGLKVGEWYRWYLKVYCDREKLYPPKVVYGWIRRVKIDHHLRSQLRDNQDKSYEVYGKAGIWFDAIDSLLRTHSMKKTSPNFQQGWQQLIKAKGVELNLPQPKCSDFAIEP